MTKKQNNSVPDVIARFLKVNGVEYVFALCGGHIMPIWMTLDKYGITIIDVRDERAAVFMAHAYSEFSGKIGVAMVTAGPGVTNAMTGIANASISRANVMIISGTPPVFQENKGALQDVNHVEFVKPLTRYCRTIREATLIPAELDRAIAHCYGHLSEPGPVYLDFPTNVLRDAVPDNLVLSEFFQPFEKTISFPDPSRINQAANHLFDAKRILVITGRGSKGCGQELIKFLDKYHALYLDTGESRGLVPDSHSSVVSSVRGSVMENSDLIVTIGRKLDFQLAFGSPAIFNDTKFIRISDSAHETRDNRKGIVEIVGDPKECLNQLVKCGGKKKNTDTNWMNDSREKHVARASSYKIKMSEAPSGSDGLMHPNRILSSLNKFLPKDNIVIADGGDFLSFARIGLDATKYLDPGSLGCLGIGSPFGVGAYLASPKSFVVVVTGDGSFGFSAMEIDTIVRHKIPILIIVANNGSWAIEVKDQQENHGKVVGTKLQFSNYAKMASAFGLHNERIEDPEDLDQAIENAVHNRPALLDILVTPEAVSADAKSGLAWVPDYQPLATWNEKEINFRKNIGNKY